MDKLAGDSFATCHNIVEKTCHCGIHITRVSRSQASPLDAAECTVLKGWLSQVRQNNGVGVRGQETQAQSLAVRRDKCGRRHRALSAIFSSTKQRWKHYFTVARTHWNNALCFTNSQILQNLLGRHSNPCARYEPAKRVAGPLVVTKTAGSFTFQMKPALGSRAPELYFSTVKDNEHWNFFFFKEGWRTPGRHYHHCTCLPNQVSQDDKHV